MDYPNGFDTNAFPAGRGLALSRTFAIWTCIALLVIVFLCGFLVWSMRSSSLKPFMVSIGSDGSEWSIVSEQSSENYPDWRVMQESVAVKYTLDRLSISANNNENEARWCSCEREQCGTDSRKCSLCCASSENVFEDFSSDVLPEYKTLNQSGEVRYISTDSLIAKPMSGTTDQGGVWRVTGKLNSVQMGSINVEAYVKIVKSETYSPLTLGFYVAAFDAYVVK